MMRVRVHLDTAVRMLPRPLIRPYFEDQHVSVTVAIGNGVSDDIVTITASADLSPRAAGALDRVLRMVGL